MRGKKHSRESDAAGERGAFASGVSGREDVDPLKKPKRWLMPWMVGDESLLSTVALAPEPKPLPASASAAVAAVEAVAAVATVAAVAAATAPEAVAAAAEIDPEAAVSSPGPGLGLVWTDPARPANPRLRAARTLTHPDPKR